MIACSVAAVVVTLYIIANYATSPDDDSMSGKKLPYKIARLVLVIAFGPPSAGCSVYFAYDYYRTNRLIFYSLQAADAGMQAMCRRSYACEALMLFCGQFAVSFGGFFKRWSCFRLFNFFR